jgi:hypothetical protein
MKRRYLFFILAFAGVLILCGNSVFAAKPQPGVMLDRTCLEAAAGTCVIIGDYTIKAYWENDKGELETVEEGQLGEKWPEKVTIGDMEYSVYKYWAGNTDPETPAPTTSYLVLDLEKEPEYLDVTGALINLDPYVCGDSTISSPRIPFKVNPSPGLTGSKDITFTIREASTYSYSPCWGNIFIQYGTDCGSPAEGGRLMMPDSQGLPALRQEIKFDCNKSGVSYVVAVWVKYDRCTGVPFHIAKCLNGPDGVSYVTYDPDTPPYAEVVTNELDENGDPIIKTLALTNVGPPEGTHICTADDPTSGSITNRTIYLWGDRGYFCGEYDSNSAVYGELYEEYDGF